MRSRLERGRPIGRPSRSWSIDTEGVWMTGASYAYENTVVVFVQLHDEYCVVRAETAFRIRTLHHRLRRCLGCLRRSDNN